MDTAGEFPSAADGPELNSPAVSAGPTHRGIAAKRTNAPRMKEATANHLPCRTTGGITRRANRRCHLHGRSSNPRVESTMSHPKTLNKAGNIIMGAKMATAVPTTSRSPCSAWWARAELAKPMRKRPARAGATRMNAAKPISQRPNATTTLPAIQNMASSDDSLRLTGLVRQTPATSPHAPRARPSRTAR
jgi:hypothetical protein